MNHVTTIHQVVERLLRPGAATTSLHGIGIESGRFRGRWGARGGNPNGGGTGTIGRCRDPAGIRLHAGLQLQQQPRILGLPLGNQRHARLHRVQPTDIPQFPDRVARRLASFQHLLQNRRAG